MPLPPVAPVAPEEPVSVEILPAQAAADLVAAVPPADLCEVLGGVPLLAVDLTDLDTTSAALDVMACCRPPVVIVGVVNGPGSPVGGDLAAGLTAGAPDVLLLSRGEPHDGQDVPGPALPGEVPVADAAAALALLATRVRRNPLAAVTLTGLLRLTPVLSPIDGLVAESLAYSMLLAGPEFAAWLARRGPVPHRDSPEPLLMQREGSRLRLTFNRPEVRNAYDTGTRDALVAALRAARLDDGVSEVVLDAVGPAFGSGGDLSQFGTAPDPATAHVIRVTCSAAAEIVRFRGRVTAHVHGVCVGAGIELPAFADHLVASPGTVFQLPEIGMGLVPGAGGTVSVTRRMGARRTAWLALSGERLDVATAARWGLVDEIVG